MKSTLFALLALTVGASLARAAASPDSASQLLQQHGAIAVAKAGPHVEPGSFRVQVAAKLGRPDETLPDGSWLYHGRRVSESEARGTLLVRFAAGRVHSLALVAPQALATLRTPPGRAGAHFVATP